MTDPLILQDQLPAPEMADDLTRGWVVGQIGHTYLVSFTDGRPPIIGTEAVTQFIISNHHINPSKEDTMPLTEANYYDEAAIEAAPQLMPYLNPSFEYLIGANIDPTLPMVRQQQLIAMKRDNWHRMVLNSRVVKPLSLDTHPERRGRPHNFRPGVEMLVWVWMPAEHPMYRTGREIALLLYRPSQVTTFTSPDQRTGRSETVTIASLDQASGVIGVIGWRSELTEVEQERANIRQWLVDFSSADESRDDFEDTEDDDPDALHPSLRDPESW